MLHIYACTHCVILILIAIVPGLFRSQLQVKDVNPHCNTHGRFVGLWMDPIRIVTDLLTECAQKEFE